MRADQRVDIVENRRKTSRVLHTPQTSAKSALCTQNFTLTQHCQHKNTHQNLLKTSLSCGRWGRVPWIRGRCNTVTRASSQGRDWVCKLSLTGASGKHPQQRSSNDFSDSIRVFRLDTRDSIIIDPRCENPTKERGYPKFQIIFC